VLSSNFISIKAALEGVNYYILGANLINLLALFQGLKACVDAC